MLLPMNNELWRVSPIFGVPSPLKSAEYWRDFFGFDLDPEEGVFAPEPTGADGVYAIVKREGVWVHFQLRQEEAPKGDRGAMASDAYIYVVGVDALFAQMMARGANVIRPVEDSPYGLRDFVVEDLNGYRIIFGEFIK